MICLWEKVSSQFNEIWAVDFEFTAPPGNKVSPICMVAKELKSGLEYRIWENDLHKIKKCPFNTGKDSLFVAYYASAEMNCFIELGWERPHYLLDLYVEHKMARNGFQDNSFNLISALAYYNIPSLKFFEKEEMRQLAIRGGPFSEQEKTDLLDYCYTDVIALEKLIHKMNCPNDLDYSLLRSEYIWSVAKMESTGIPIDFKTLSELKKYWPEIRASLIEEQNKKFKLYENGVFKQNLFQKFLNSKKIAWPRTATGQLKLDDDTFRDQAKAHPEINEIAELRNTISKLKLNDLAIGVDERNRVLLSPYKSKTGRNQPSNSKFVFGPSRWIRGMIAPTENKALAYIDWSQQEFGIAAALSKDENMRLAYLSGDPYLEFAKQAGAVPSDATKHSHKKERNKFKGCVLAVQYGMGQKSLAERLNISEKEAQHLLNLHKQTYKKFWKWSQSFTDTTLMNNTCNTVFGWTLHISKEPNVRSIANFPMQANGAEMLRLACMLLVEAGITVCAPIHDAILIEADAKEIENEVKKAQLILKEASRIILDGFELQSDFEIIKYPDRYMDENGKDFWLKVIGLLDLHKNKPVHTSTSTVHL